MTTRYTLDGSLVKFEMTGSTSIWYYYNASGSPVGMCVGGTSLYLYRKNLQGDITGIYSGSTGTLLVSYVYDAWGKPTITDVAGTTESANLITRSPYLYRGYRYDHETGLYYLQSRYYDPETGRFVNADSFVSTGQGMFSTNMFAYCENNPVINADSDGFSCCRVLDRNLMVTDAGGGGGGAIGALCIIAIYEMAQLLKDTVKVKPLTKSVDIALPTSIAKEKEKEDSSPTYIYRYRGATADNLVPTERDVNSKHKAGLSFALTEQPNSWRTTIEAVNATNVLKADIDGPNHVTVYPAIGTTRQWHEQGVNSIWTQTLLEICVAIE